MPLGTLDRSPPLSSSNTTGRWEIIGQEAGEDERPSVGFGQGDETGAFDECCEFGVGDRCPTDGERRHVDAANRTLPISREAVVVGSHPERSRRDLDRIGSGRRREPSDPPPRRRPLRPHTRRLRPIAGPARHAPRRALSLDWARRPRAGRGACGARRRRRRRVVPRRRMANRHARSRVLRRRRRREVLPVLPLRSPAPRPGDPRRGPRRGVGRRAFPGGSTLRVPARRRWRIARRRSLARV